ncbi:zinc-finger protein [Coemansia sp. RSA 1822]|nr:zinc-finger protein [Coemansia sp. RSA 720]KAJ2475425.1 zinc-finger protein [Coemansia sp. RSA 2131]KAJ2538375.1 zinc-finger protein [Coemansia sp. RSA 1853]KAJ2564691.1 zinc-finger protein [Coemansia sp. RSA 1822]
MIDEIGGRPHSRSTPDGSTLPPLHGHTQGQGAQGCDSADCERPLKLPSLSALGITETAGPGADLPWESALPGIRTASPTAGYSEKQAAALYTRASSELQAQQSTSRAATRASLSADTGDGVQRASPRVSETSRGVGMGDAAQRCLWSTCTQIFNSIDELVRHLYKLHVATNRTAGYQPVGGGYAAQGLRATADFLCRWASCGTRAQDTEELIDHVCRDHLDAAHVLHRCGWTGCLQDHETITGLTEHLSGAHIGSGRSSYICEWQGCERGGRPFTQRQRALRHIQTHTGVKPFACQVCAKRFSEAHIMQQHLRVHTGEKPFKCVQDGCGKEFAVSSALTIHRRTHTGERPYECRFGGCDRRFAESSNLTKHMRIHTGERPFKCPQSECGKTFSRPDQVSRHQRMHSGRRPLPCPIEQCKKSFSTPATRQSHLRSLHPDATADAHSPQ